MYKVTKFCGIMLDSQRGISIRAELFPARRCYFRPPLILWPISICGAFFFLSGETNFEYFYQISQNENLIFQKKPQVHSDYFCFFKPICLFGFRCHTYDFISVCVCLSVCLSVCLCVCVFIHFCISVPAICILFLFLLLFSGQIYKMFHRLSHCELVLS